jgi:eukaryotic-like serine/threonine-protein kinase
MEAGTIIGAYRIFSKIGEGGMGTVFLAEHTMLGRRAAIKILHRKYTVQPDIVTRFFNEARAAAAIADPGIVQIFDFGYHQDGSAYIAMELLEGDPLDRRLHRLGRFPVAEALRIIRQVAASLGVAHARGIIHRDLKPENIFLIRDPEVPGGERPKILDFGIAKLSGDPSIRTDTSAVLGTPAFMSPEQCRGAGRVDLRTDIYSLGCVLFVLLTGRLPFEAEGAGELISMHLREQPPSPSYLVPGIPAEVDELVLRCLAKDPAHRFATGAELAAQLGHLAASPLATPAATAVASSGNLSSPSQLAVAMVTAEPLRSAQQTTLMRRGGSTTLVARLTSSRWTWAGLGAMFLLVTGLTIYATGGGAEPGTAANSLDDVLPAAPGPVAPLAKPTTPLAKPVPQADIPTSVPTSAPAPAPAAAAPASPPRGVEDAGPIAAPAVAAEGAVPQAPAAPAPTTSPAASTAPEPAKPPKKRPRNKRRPVDLSRGIPDER